MESASHPPHATVPPALAQPRTPGLSWPFLVAAAAYAGVIGEYSAKIYLETKGRSR